MNNNNEQCSCFRLEQKITPPKYDFTTGKSTCGTIQVTPRCYGTKEKEVCSCNGDPSKCNFYKEKRKENKMKEEKLSTAEMWLRAQKDGKSYVLGCVLYNKKLGFVDKTCITEQWPMDSFSTFEQFMNANEWYEFEVPVYTKEEAEKKLNAIII